LDARILNSDANFKNQFLTFSASYFYNKNFFFSIYLNLKLFSISCFSSLENRAGCIADNGKSIGEVRAKEEL